MRLENTFSVNPEILSKSFTGLQDLQNQQDSPQLWKLLDMSMTVALPISVIGITGVRMFVKGDEPTTVEPACLRRSGLRNLGLLCGPLRISAISAFKKCVNAEIASEIRREPQRKNEGVES
jgi:hypothetical protein